MWKMVTLEDLGMSGFLKLVLSNLYVLQEYEVTLHR